VERLLFLQGMCFQIEKCKSTDVFLRLQPAIKVYSSWIGCLLDTCLLLLTVVIFGVRNWEDNGSPGWEMSLQYVTDTRRSISPIAFISWRNKRRNHY
jgi:hypothetical protein